MNEGLSFKVPLAETVMKVDVRVQPHPFREIDASSKEYQIVKMTGMMNFHIDPAFVNDLYQKVGLDFAEKVIDPAFNDFVKETQTHGFRRPDRFAGNEHLHGRSNTDQPREPLRAFRTRDDSEIYFRLARLRIGTGDAILSGHGQFQSSA